MTDGYTGKRFRDPAEGPGAHAGRPASAGGHFARPDAPSAGATVGGAAAGRRFPSPDGSAPRVAPAATGARFATGAHSRPASSRPTPSADSTVQLDRGSMTVSAPAPAATAEFMAVAPRPASAGGAPASGRGAMGGAAASQAPVAPVAPMSPVVPPRGPRRGRPEGDSGEPPRRRGRNIVSTLLIVLGVGLLLVAGGIFVKAQLGYRAAQSTYDDLQQYALKDSEGDDVPNVDFDELAKINPDVVGWIYVPDTVISYPVVQTTNNDKYLYKLFDLSGNGSGSIFMDMDDTAPGVVDQQTTLYGHHMYDGSMFKIIDDTLSSQEAFDAFDKVYYITRENTFVFKPLFTAQVMDEYVDARRANFDGDLTLAQYLEQTLEQAKSYADDAEERIPETKQVLSLVTCAGEIIPRTTRAVMVCSLEETIARQ